MKTTLDHLPDHIQDQLHTAVDIIRGEIQPGMIILFGSYARGDQVDKHYEEDGILHHKQSDFDILVVCDTEHQVTKVERNGTLDKKLDSSIRTPINLITHDIGYINK